jgi:hypothetical protein
MRSARIITALVAVSGAAAAASAQYTPDSTVSYSLFWSELDADYQPVSSPNGVLDRGERALLRLSVSFTNQNMLAHFSPPVGTFTSGTIRGFAGGFLDLNGTATVGNAAALWNLDPSRGYGLQFPFDAVGEAGFGTPAAGGATLIGIEPLQFSGFIHTTNPIPAVWIGVWTPESYEPREIQFRTTGSVVAGSGPFSAVMLRFSATSFGSARCDSSLGGTMIPVVPSTGVALIPLAPMVRRRRRRPFSA